MPEAVEKAIWKFQFGIKDEFAIEMPMGARLITAQVQNGIPCIWAIVDPIADPVRRYFSIRGTGHPLGGEAGPYFGTFQTEDGALVWHLFAEAE